MTQNDALSILQTGANVFLTGEPGSGKTHTVNAYVAWLRSHGIEPAITASTGIAATHIHGMTIHSWSGIGIKSSLSAADLDAIASKEHVAKRISKTRVLIIDEVSMLSGEVLTMVSRVMREVMQSEAPFAGIQVVLVGDFFQLPPISREGDAKFAFESSAWAALNPIVCYLSEQHRQDDPAFFSVLTNLRTGECDHTDVSKLTERSCDEADIADEVPRLYTHNADVDKLNDEKLAALPGKSQVFAMSSNGSPVMVEGLKRGCLSPETLLLKENALVMCTKNNPASGYANGTLGRVTGFESFTGYPIIETKDGRTLTISPMDWAVEEQGKVRAKITQLPLRLAWAITVHKSQGMSMDSAAMDLSKVFEYGQGYVALSRVRRLSGLHLLGWNEGALKLHPKVAERDADFRAMAETAAQVFGELESSGERTELEKRFILASGGSLAMVAPDEPVSKRSTYDETLELLQEGKTLEAIAKERSLTAGTIVTHLEKLAASGQLQIDDVRAAAPAHILDGLDAIEAAFSKTTKKALTPAWKKLKGKYSYDDLKLARILLTD